MGRVEVHLRKFLTSALEGGELSASRRFTSIHIEEVSGRILEPV